MNRFFIAFGIVFVSLFFGAFLLFLLLANSFDGNTQAAAQYGVGIYTLIIVIAVGWPGVKEWKAVDTRQFAIYRLLGILVGLFVWYFSCGQIVFQF